jgi:hypothetical protein
MLPLNATGSRSSAANPPEVSRARSLFDVIANELRPLVFQQVRDHARDVAFERRGDARTPRCCAWNPPS